MIIPKIGKKIEKFISSETGLISKKKLLSTGIAVVMTGALLKDNFVYAKEVHASYVYYQKDLSPAAVIGTDTRAILCTTPTTSAHASASNHANAWDDGHASVDAPSTTMDVAKKCYFHNDNFVPTVASDGKSVQSTHAHSYSAGDDKAVPTQTFSGSPDGRGPWK